MIFLRSWRYFQGVLDEYFNGYILKGDKALFNTLNLNEDNGYGITFHYLNEPYVFFQNPSHMM